jgi:hypothetical protein
MRTVKLNNLIEEFFSLGRELQDNPSLNGELALHKITSWYKEVRLYNSFLVECSDMVLLEWGNSQYLDINEPTDLHLVSKLNYTKSKFEYLGFVRQLFSVQNEEQIDFEDVAIHLSIRLHYGPMVEKELSHLWIDTPDNVDEKVKDFKANPFVKKLINAQPSKVNIVVEPCG